MKWATWEHVGVDRMGCAWLIRRWIDPEAVFVFLPEGTLQPPPDATAFDIPGARFSHHLGHSSFYALVQHYGLHNQVIDRIAAMIDEADVASEISLEAAAPGLDLICRGIRLTSPDDHTALERGFLIYEALYAALAQDTGG